LARVFSDFTMSSLLRELDSFSSTTLNLAVEVGDEAVVKALLDYSDQTAVLQEELGRRQLNLTVLSQQIGMAKIFLAKRAIEPDLKKSFGRTPLSLVAEGGNLDLADLLL